MTSCALGSMHEVHMRVTALPSHACAQQRAAAAAAAPLRDQIRTRRLNRGLQWWRDKERELSSVSQQR